MFWDLSLSWDLRSYFKRIWFDGLAEKADALAMVVSEERGKISIFDKGKYRQMDDPAKLVAAIIAHWKHASSYPFELPEGRKRWLDMIPSSMELSLASIVEQEVDIKPQLVGKLPGGLKIIEIKMIPQKVKVLSPEATGKKKATDVITTPIYLEGIYNDTSLFCKIIAPPSFQPADKRWPDVEVVIKVGY